MFIDSLLGRFCSQIAGALHIDHCFGWQLSTSIASFYQPRGSVGFRVSWLKWRKNCDSVMHIVVCNAQRLLLTFSVAWFKFRACYFYSEPHLPHNVICGRSREYFLHSDWLNLWQRNDCGKIWVSGEWTCRGHQSSLFWICVVWSHLCVSCIMVRCKYMIDLLVIP